VESGLLASEALVAVEMRNAQPAVLLVDLHAVVQSPFLQLAAPVHLHALVAEVAVENRTHSLQQRQPLYRNLCLYLDYLIRRLSLA